MSTTEQDNNSSPFKYDPSYDVNGQCSSLLVDYNTTSHKPVYKVGVLAIRGKAAANVEFNKTFSDYLTATAGQRFSTPVRFEMKALDFLELFNDTESAEVDFFYVNPSAYSCIESEFGAHSLVSQISKRVVGGITYDLTEFGGVIFTHVNSTVKTIQDIKDKIVAAASISGLGSGQMQFRRLIQEGLHYINDPKQVVFTSNQGKVVNGVLNGEFDVGFVRTDQIERTMDSTGKLVDKTQFKIIEPLEGLNIGGEPFPFASSTPLYAEWNVASLSHVSNDVNMAVQAALLALSDHAAVGEELYNCMVERGCLDFDGATSIYASEQECRQTCHDNIVLPSPRCDTTPELALLSHSAKKAGKYTGWRSTLTYMELRNMQEETGFIRKNPETGKMQCIRSGEIYHAVVCPPGHFKKSMEDVKIGCQEAGLRCGNKFQCLCKPCIKAFDVNVFPKISETNAACEKFSICGRFNQRQALQFVANDNKEREDMKLHVKLHEGESSRRIQASYIHPNDLAKDANSFIKSQATNYTQVFTISANKVGVMVMEVFANGEQIPESPFRVVVAPRDCSEFGENRVPDVDGNCVCAPNTVEKNGICSAPSKNATIALAVVGGVLGVLVFVFVVIFAYRRYKAIRKLQLQHEMKMQNTLKEALRSTVNLDYPLHLVHASTFLTGGKLRRHELMRDEHKLRVLDTMEAVDSFVSNGKLIVFFSHQWTAFDQPDHTGDQYEAMVKSLRAITVIKGFHSMQDVWVWVDYSCIPQCNASTQALAIRSLAPYASSACVFIIIAPTLKHKNLPVSCDLQTYQSRMWCRAEQVCYLMRNGPEDMFIGTGDDDEPFKRIDEQWFQEALRVFHGQLTCCRLEHKGMSGCDRQSLVVPILGLFGELYRASEDMMRRSDSGMGNVNESVLAFMQQIEKNQGEIFPREFDLVIWRKNKKVTDRVLLFGDLIERMREHIKDGGDAEVTLRTFGDEGPKSDTIEKKDPMKRRSSDFLRHGTVHGNVAQLADRRESSDFLRFSSEDVSKRTSENTVVSDGDGSDKPLTYKVGGTVDIEMAQVRLTGEAEIVVPPRANGQNAHANTVHP